ncbi:VID27-like protein isoform X2 [Nilaparvata lugens]|uniref:VID27-like protein isoform X2 n=1 Tax=Nilaparvata lugens TaxID=108931 RepID=UPI00193DA756|nr:VID27-like protein isoform X2 [Nilaparvata lugens]
METQAVSTPEKEVEKKPVEKEIVKENDVEEKVEKEEETKKETNGEAPEESKNGDSADKEEPTTENEDSSDVSDKCAIKRKSVGGGDATDNLDATEEKKAKLDADEAPAVAEPVTNGV